MTAKKKAKIQAKDVEVKSRSLEVVLADHAEQMREHKEVIRAALADIRTALADIAVLARENRTVLPHLFALTQDHMAIAERTGKLEVRVEVLEKAS